MRFFKSLGLFIAIACLVWVGVLWRWQVTQRDMSAQDILVYLAALPLTVFVLVLLARWAVRGAAERAAAAPPAPAATAATTSGTAAAAPAGDDAQRHATAQLLAATVRCAAGASVDDVLDAAEAGKPRPGLDAELHDGQGLPVMCARVADLGVDEIDIALEALAAPLRQTQPAWQHEAASPALQRALALLQPALLEAVDALSPWSARLGIGGAGAATDKSQPRVRVLVAWPEGLGAFELALAGQWLAQALRHAGEGLVAADRWLIQPTPPTAGASGPQLWLEADHLLQALQRDGHDDLVLLAACHSDVNDATVQRLDDAGQLFSSRRPKAVIPGEGAAALLLASAAWPPARDDGPPAPHLHRAAVARRDKSVDATGRLSADLATELLRQALAAAQLPAQQAGGLADDADQHSPRGAEMYGAMLAQLPQLDATEDQRMAGHLCGRLGAAATLLAVGMAARRASATSRPCLALSVADAHWRLALVARPEAPPPAPAEAAAAARRKDA